MSNSLSDISLKSLVGTADSDPQGRSTERNWVVGLMAEELLDLRGIVEDVAIMWHPDFDPSDCPFCSWLAGQPESHPWLDDHYPECPYPRAIGWQQRHPEAT